MAGNYVVMIDGLEVDLLEGVNSENRKAAASKALNAIARKARTRAAALIRDDINLPASYVSPGGKRLFVSQFATPSNLESRVSARVRPMSLARFVVGNPKIGRAGVHVEVGRGKAKFLKRAFVIKLRAGAAEMDTKFNLGLAIRLRPGETFHNKYSAKRIDRGLYALYGPSVSQIFRAADGAGVAQDMGPEIAENLLEEFTRLAGL